MPASSSTGSGAVGATWSVVWGMGAACSGTVPAEDKAGRVAGPAAGAPTALGGHLGRDQGRGKAGEGNGPDHRNVIS